jgi:ABC-type sugar transport system ATPase subunit
LFGSGYVRIFSLQVGLPDVVLILLALRARLRQASKINRLQELTLVAQQSVEIARAISLNVRVLIMDEPTASLSAT